MLSILALAAAPPAEPPPPPDLEVPQQGAPPVLPIPGTCSPAKLVRLVVRNISPGLAAGDPRAQPRVMYRRGATYLRSEEQPDANRNGAKAVVIVAEPDAWAIDLSTRTGRHSIDRGPDFAVHAPILPLVQDLPPVFKGLEFGCEASFVAANAPQAQRTVPWGETLAALHSVTVGDQTVALLMDSRRAEPLMVSYLRQGKAIWVVRYDEFRADLPDRPDLFMPPKSVVIEEAPAPGAAQPPQPTPPRMPARPPSAAGPARPLS
ncbi:MAG TPA: hypothetical protein VFH92_00335 [Phenylobacterium sp.]|nr:hypothetical protein [Phenylobacterium sp.]